MNNSDSGLFMLMIFAFAFVLLIIGLLSNLVARKVGGYLKLNKQKLVINIINILYLLLFVAIYFPNILRSQINVLDGVTAQEKKQIDYVMNLDEAIINTNLYTRWVSIFTALVGFYATKKVIHKTVCVLNILIGIIGYGIVLLILFLGAGGTYFGGTYGIN